MTTVHASPSVRARRRRTLIVRFLALTAVLTGATAAIAAQPCVSGGLIVMPSPPTVADSIVLGRMIGPGENDQVIADVMISGRTIALTSHYTSEFPPPVVPPWPPNPPERCGYSLATIGKLPEGVYDVHWRLHDTYHDAYSSLPGGQMQFAVVASVPTLGALAKIILAVAFTIVGWLMIRQ
jgi:hypothetical protein